MVYNYKSARYTKVLKSFPFSIYYFLFFSLLIGFFASNPVEAQLIPRVGYPYCQPFIGPFDNLNRKEDLKGLSDANFPTGDAVRLTSNTPYDAGFFYIDLPFVPENGIQVSFEYLIHGGRTATDLGADGMTFFMFDGKYGDPAKGFLPFQLGGTGGALGYASRISGPEVGFTYQNTGLSGGYIGLGLDVWGNYVSKEFQAPENRKPNGRGGLGTPEHTSSPADFLGVNSGPYSNSVAIRGPASTDYDLIQDVRVFQTFGKTIFSENRFPYSADNCTINEDFRKVYLGLQPFAGGYNLTVWIKFGTDDPEEVINTLYNQGEIPETLKLGFAAANGDNVNFHEIRNLAVGIFEDEASVPTFEDFEIRACEDETEVLFDVELERGTGPRTFIRCIELYKELDGVPPKNSISNPHFPLTCEIAPICDICLDSGKEIEVPGFGIFEVLPLGDIDLDGLDTENDKVTISFKPFSNRSIYEDYIYYTVTDNFGVTSDPARFTVIFNRIPEFVPQDDGQLYTIDPPTCDGQNDGSIIATVRHLVEGYEYNWTFIPEDSNEVITPDPNSQSVSALDGDIAVFTLNGISRGKYILEVKNPQNNIEDEPFCIDFLEISVIEELGTPVAYDDDIIICQSENPLVIPPPSISGTVEVTPVFIWYDNPSRSGDAIIRSDNDQSVEKDGVTYSAETDGTLTIIGLTSNGGSERIYELYVELETNRDSDTNLCSFEGDIEEFLSITVFPEITFNVLSKQEDWCLDVTIGGGGSINLEAKRGNDPVASYTLLDKDLAELRPAQGSGEFNNLPKGEYTVKFEVNNPYCEAYYPFEIDGPEERLQMNVDFRHPTCEEDNGWIEWEAREGNGGYTMVSIEGYPGGTPTVDQSGGVFRINNLISQEASYTLTLTVEDSRGCKISISETIAPQVLPVYELANAVICINENVSLLPSTLVGGFPNPETVFRWYSNPEATEEIVSGENSTIGATFTINSTTGQLTVSGFQNDGTYTFYMKPEVLNGCDMPIVPVTLTVNPLPAPVFVEFEPSCFGESDGRLVLESGGQSIYSYELVGSSIVFDGTAFVGIPAGDYIIRVTNTDTGCTEDFPGNLGQPDLLVLDQVDLVDPTCGFDNGEIAYRFNGGTSAYKVFLNGELIREHGENEIGGTHVIDELAGGTYTLSIEDANGCSDEFEFVMAPREFPEFGVTDAVICELDPSTPSRDFLTATVSPEVINLSNAEPSYSWYYIDGAGNEIQIQNGDTVFGASASIDGQANLSLQGLAGNVEPYTVYLRVTGENVCDNSLIPSTITVNPLPTPVFTTEDVSCFEGSDGSIILESGGLDEYVYELIGLNTPFDDNAFVGLPAGAYTVRVTNTLTDCYDDFIIEIGQPDVLQVTEEELIDPTCDLDNGIVRYRITGGTAAYTVFLNGDEIGVFESDQENNVLEIGSLPGGNHILQVVDANECTSEFEFSLDPRELPEFATVSTVICEIDPDTRASIEATVSPEVITLSNAIPQYSWYYLDGSGSEVQITDGSIVFGAVSSISADGSLTLIGLEANDIPYVVYMRVSGDNVCDDSLIPAEILVNPLPAPSFVIEDVSCYDGANGSIVLDSGGLAIYEYELLGEAVNFENEAFDNLAAGIYVVRVTNSETGCYDDFELEILQPDPLLLLDIEGEDPTCGQPNGEISFRVTGGTPDYSISINGEDLESFEHNISGTGRIFVRGLEPGTYTVSVIDDNECETEQVDWIILTNNDGEEVTAIPDEIIICEGGIAVLEPEITVGGGLTPTLTWYFDANLTEPIAAGTDAEGVDYSFAADGSMQVSGLPEGNYEYFVRIGGDGICVTSTFGTVEVLAPLLADVEVDDIICFGEENGVIRVTDLSGGTGDYEFSLDGTNWQEENEFTDLAPGTYTVSIRDNSQLEGCILEIPDVEIASPPGPLEINEPQKFAESCSASNGEIFGLEISGGWGNYEFQWKKDDPDTGQELEGTLSGISGLEAGIYYLLVKDEKGCEEVFEFEIEEAPDPEYILLPPIDECEGYDVILAPLHVAVSPGTPTARTDVSWYTGENQTGLIQDGQDPNNSDIVYTIDDSDWLNPKLNISGLPPGTYTYYFFVECTGVEMPISVTIEPTPQVVFDTEDETCFGDADGKINVLSGHVNGYEYVVNGTSYTVEQLENASFIGGDYTVEVISPNGCIQVRELTIEAATEFSLDLLDSKNAACDTDDGFVEVEVSGGRANYTLVLTETVSNTTRTLSGEGPVFKFDNLPRGIYIVQATDESGCVTELSAPIEVEDGPSEIILDPEYFVCVDEEVELLPGVNPSNSGATFNWYLNSVNPSNRISDGQSIGSATITLNGNGTRFLVSGLSLQESPLNLVVTVEGPGICEGDVFETRVIVQETPSVTASTEDEVCYGDLGKIFLNPGSSSGSLEYSVNGGPFRSYSGNVIEDLDPGVYLITARNQAGCIFDLEPINIEGPEEELSLEGFGNVGASCEEDNGIVFGEVTGGEAPYSLEIRRGNQVVSNPTEWSEGNFQVTGLSLGTYSVVITDSRGCVVDAGTTEVTDEPTPIDVNDALICEGEVAELRPFIPGVSSSPGFRWYFDASKTTQIPLGRSDFDGKTYDLSANGVLRINGLLLDEAPYFYYVELALDASCELELAEAKVEVNPLPQLRTFNPSLVCDPTETVNLTNFIENFNPNLYDYEVISPSGLNMRVEDLETVSFSGNYVVRAKFKNADCWTSQERIAVRIANEELGAYFNYELDLGNGTIVVNEDIGVNEEVSFIDDTSGDPIAWQWDFGDGNTSSQKNPKHTYSEKGPYTITLTTYSEIGCVSVYQRVVDVFDDYLIIFPNAFTPKREDGKNVLFYPKYRGLAELKMYIFNTWGDLIYVSENFEQGGWNGLLNGAEVPNGNYVYKAEYMSRGGERGTSTGVFILIK